MPSRSRISRFRRPLAAAGVLAALAAGIAVPGALQEWMRDDTRPPPEVSVGEGGSEPAGDLGGGPTLWVAMDPACSLCARTEEELARVVRPEELGVDVRFRPRLPEDPPGPWPRLRLIGRTGQTLGSVRGYRPPGVLRRWLEQTLARDEP